MHTTTARAALLALLSLSTGASLLACEATLQATEEVSPQRRRDIRSGGLPTAK